MAKRNGIVKAEVPGVLAQVDPGATIEGENPAGKMGRLALYQGTMQEQTIYEGCDFKPGDYIDVLERRKVASNRIVPIWAFKTWVRWSKDAKIPDYVAKSPSDVPKGDLDWKDGKPPAASVCINAIILVEGEAFPYLFIFKRTGLRAGDLLFTLESRGSSVYELGSTVDKNAVGQAFRRVSVKHAGKCPDELKPIRDHWKALVKASVEEYRAKATEAVEPEEAEGSDTPPF